MLLSVSLTLLPILIIVFLMVRRQFAADTSGAIGWLLTVIIAILFFNTSPEAGLRSSAAGIIASFPVSLMVVTSILQITFMEATGALKRITVFVKTFASADKAVQIMLINVGAGTLLVSVGATPVSILPPILVALGYSAFVAVALPAIGFDAHFIRTCVYFSVVQFRRTYDVSGCVEQAAFSRPLLGSGRSPGVHCRGIRHRSAEGLATGVSGRDASSGRGDLGRLDRFRLGL